MRQKLKLRHEFVDCIPDALKECVIYISIPYATAIHKCFCGCGHEVVTPFSPTDWTLIFNGESVSIKPSIGNWSFPCQSHYWITHNQVEWAEQWSRDQIDCGREYDRQAKTRMFDESRQLELNSVQVKGVPGKSRISMWSKLKQLFAR